MITIAMGNEMPVRGGALGHFGDARRAAIGDTLVERVVKAGSLVIRKLGGRGRGRLRSIGSCRRPRSRLRHWRIARRLPVKGVGLWRHRTRRRSISPAARSVAVALGRRVMAYRLGFSCIR